MATVVGYRENPLGRGIRQAGQFASKLILKKQDDKFQAEEKQKDRIFQRELEQMRSDNKIKQMNNAITTQTNIDREGEVLKKNQLFASIDNQIKGDITGRMNNGMGDTAFSSMFNNAMKYQGKLRSDFTTQDEWNQARDDNLTLQSLRKEKLDEQGLSLLDGKIVPKSSLTKEKRFNKDEQKLLRDQDKISTFYKSRGLDKEFYNNSKPEVAKIINGYARFSEDIDSASTNSKNDFVKEFNFDEPIHDVPLVDLAGQASGKTRKEIARHLQADQQINNYIRDNYDSVVSNMVEIELEKIKNVPNYTPKTMQQIKTGAHETFSKLKSVIKSQYASGFSFERVDNLAFLSPKDKQDLRTRGFVDERGRVKIGADGEIIENDENTAGKVGFKRSGIRTGVSAGSYYKSTMDSYISAAMYNADPKNAEKVSEVSKKVEQHKQKFSAMITEAEKDGLTPDEAVAVLDKMRTSGLPLEEQKEIYSRLERNTIRTAKPEDLQITLLSPQQEKELKAEEERKKQANQLTAMDLKASDIVESSIEERVKSKIKSRSTILDALGTPSAFAR